MNVGLNVRLNFYDTRIVYVHALADCVLLQLDFRSSLIGRNQNVSANQWSKLGLKRVVIMAVAREDLKDGGAQIFTETIRAVRRRNPFCSIEVLPSDMNGKYDDLENLNGYKVQYSKGFSHYELGPLVRSSYHDDEEVEAAG